MKTLKIEELSKNFGTTEVLRKINLEIDEGNFLVLLGPSGCGKSDPHMILSSPRKSRSRVPTRSV